VESGRVYLNKRNLARLCSQRIKEVIYEMIKNIPSVPEFIQSYSNRLKKDKEKMLRKIEKYDFSDMGEERFPPCIKWLMSRIGGGLSHPGRFTLVTFLHRIGYDTEDIINIFRRVPDFNERLTRYQVEHILGMKGSRIEYSVPSCKKIKSYGFCFPDEDCRYIRHPLQYLIKLKKREKHD
jgi:DNA primase large subunit